MTKKIFLTLFALLFILFLSACHGHGRGGCEVFDPDGVTAISGLKDPGI